MNRIATIVRLFGFYILVASPGFSQIIPGDGDKNGVVDSRDAIILQQNWHKQVNNGTATLTIDLDAPPVALRLIRIPAGSFMMGSPDTERSHFSSEGPVHQVDIGYDFYMGETEVTQGQWEAVMGSNPANDYGVGANYPVYNVSWEDCQAFIAALNAREQEGTYRLPSEAEWEYACRAGTTTRFYFGNSLGCRDECENCEDESIIRGKNQPHPPLEGFWSGPKSPGLPTVRNRTDYMWYCGADPGQSQPVRQLLPNRFGLYDMLGNVLELCQDSYHNDYTGAPNDGSAWEESGNSLKVARGGNWTLVAFACRSAARAAELAILGSGGLGFRLAWTP